jgi:guanylate kinase
MGPLFILSGPSGCGKSTVIRQLLASEPERPLRLSVSATTRKERPGEKDGIHYWFWDRERFLHEVETGAFLEWAEVYGNCYGTLKREVGPYRQQGSGVILDIDTQGARQVKQQCPDALRILLRTSSMSAYEERLKKRGTETAESLQRRLAAAQRELDRAADYEHTVINDDLETAVAELRKIIGHLFPKD